MTRYIGKNAYLYINGKNMSELLSDVQITYDTEDSSEIDTQVTTLGTYEAEITVELTDREQLHTLYWYFYYLYHFSLN